MTVLRYGKIGNVRENLLSVLLVLQTLIFFLYLRSLNDGQEKCVCSLCDNYDRAATHNSGNKSVNEPFLLQFEKGRKGFTITYPNEAQKTEAAKNKRHCNIASRVIVANYGTSDFFKRRQKVSCRMALENGADACVSFTPEFLDEEFKARHRQTLKRLYGAGLFVWKPYIVMHAILAMQPDDYLFYLDSDFVAVNSFNPYICFLHQHEFDIVPFAQPYPEYPWSKADAYFLMNMDNVSNVAETVQPKGGQSFIKRTPRSIRYVGEWLTYAQDPRILSNSSSFIKDEHKDFIENRHDQTIWSLLSKKWNLTVFPDPVLPWQRNSIESYVLGPGNKTFLLKTYNPVDLDLPNHPIDALLRYCPFCP